MSLRSDEIARNAEDSAVIQSGLFDFKSLQEIGCFLPSLDSATLRRLKIVNTKHLRENQGDQITELKEDYGKHIALDAFVETELGMRSEEQREPDRVDQFNVVMSNLFMAVMNNTSKENWKLAKIELESLDTQTLSENQKERLRLALNVTKRTNPEF
jgi:hypothetical protein